MEEEKKDRDSKQMESNREPGSSKAEIFTGKSEAALQQESALSPKCHGVEVFHAQNRQPAESDKSLKPVLRSLDSTSSFSEELSPAINTSQSSPEELSPAINTSQSSPEESPRLTDDSSFIVGRSIKTKVLHRINFGAYGSIHRGVFLKTNEEVAVKLEPLRSPRPQLLAEGAAMRHLENGPGIPTIRWFGSYEPKYNVMVMDLLGPSVQQLLAVCGHRFTLKTVLLMADQMLETLEFVHSSGYVHRDIKPDNFVVGFPGTEKERQIYLLDFGLAKKFHRQRYSLPVISSSYMVHPVAGTVRYMSLRAHDGQGDQPRDDLESLCYVFAYLFKGRLPWQGIRGCKSKEEKIGQVRKTKASMSPQEICSDMPEQFAAFLEKCRRARVYDAESSAKNWRKVFSSLAESLSIEYDYRFDWVLKKEESQFDFMGEALKAKGHASS